MESIGQCFQQDNSANSETLLGVDCIFQGVKMVQITFMFQSELYGLNFLFRAV